MTTPHTQHDRHCLLLFEGRPWRITRIRQPYRILVQEAFPHPRSEAIEIKQLNLAGVDWPSYVEAANRMLALTDTAPDKE